MGGIKNNKADGVETELIILLNKCDEMIDGCLVDEELDEMREQATNIMKDYTDVVPICISAEDSFIYRILRQNPNTELDAKYISKIGTNEFGKSRWSRLSSIQQREKIKSFFAKTESYEICMENTGFRKFIGRINEIIDDNSHILANNILRITAEIVNTKELRPEHIEKLGVMKQNILKILKSPKHVKYVEFRKKISLIIKNYKAKREKIFSSGSQYTETIYVQAIESRNLLQAAASIGLVPQKQISDLNKSITQYIDTACIDDISKNCENLLEYLREHNKCECGSTELLTTRILAQILNNWRGQHTNRAKIVIQISDKYNTSKQLVMDTLLNGSIWFIEDSSSITDGQINKLMEFYRYHVRTNCEFHRRLKYIEHKIVEKLSTAKGYISSYSRFYKAEQEESIISITYDYFVENFNEAYIDIESI
jgi:hypothetical protein